jgi:hypothetical protein
MEVNGRHNLSSLLSVRCGINFPWLQYQHLVLGQPPSAGEYQSDVYWVDITRDIGYSLMYLRYEKLPLVQYLRPYLSRHVYAIFALRDLRPFMTRLTFLVKEAVVKMLSKLQRKQAAATNTSRAYSA